MTTSGIAPQFGGTLFIKADSQKQADAIDTVLWGVASADSPYAFSPNDKQKLLTQDTYVSSMRFDHDGSVLYASAESDEDLAKLGQAMTDETGAAVIHRPGTIQSSSSSALTSITERASELDKNWKADSTTRETELSKRQLSVNA